MRDSDIHAAFQKNSRVMAICGHLIDQMRAENVIMYRCLRETIFYLALNATLGAPAFVMLEEQYVADLNDAELLTTIADILLVP